MNHNQAIQFDNTYAQLPGRFYSRQPPTAVAKPGLIRVNHEVCRLLQIDPAWLESGEGVEVVAGNRLPGGAEPIATVYAGHQFGHFNPQLGDGRAILLGEVIGTDGHRYDIQLKGAGATAYSRNGDGRAPLGAVLREYVVSEAMAKLGIATTRSLAAVTTGDRVYREQPLPGGVLARVARSHIRIGTFQFFAAQGDEEALRLLLDHVIARHYPAAAEATNPCRALLDCVIAEQAKLIASWQLVGFIHGVMNTDNMLLSGETIDYGPCAFMDAFDPETVFSSIDHAGRYAYGKQPGIAHWNLACLAQALLPLMDLNQATAIQSAQEAVNRFPDLYREAHLAGMRRKLGLYEPQAEDATLIEDLQRLMTEHRTDFTLTFRYLAAMTPGPADPAHCGMFTLPPAFAPWVGRWQGRASAEHRDQDQRQRDMFKVNPLYIPRNHLVEEAIAAAVVEDFRPFHELVEVLAQPGEYRQEWARFALPPREDQIVQQTFCGT